MDHFPLLSLILFLPLLGALFIFLIHGEEKIASQNSRAVALWVSLVNLFLVGVLAYQFDLANPHLQFVENSAWIPFLSVRYHLGVDGLSLGMMALTALLIPLALLSSWRNTQKRVREYMIAFLVLETFLMGAFCALDLILFYLFFEGVLIPMLFIIGIWGGERRLFASFKFFLFTLAGSLLMLLAILAIYSEVGATDLALVLTHPLPLSLQLWGFVAFFIAFAVKTPLWPLHTWLPDAHVEAPTGGSVLLAGVLLKLGVYGMLRFLIPLFPQATLTFKPLAIALSLIAILYASFITLVQTDMKRLVAYSSVAHMGFVTLGIFTLTLSGITGAVVQMISHGLISAGLFLAIGVIYDRLKTREIDKVGGLMRLMPLFAVLLMIFTLASLGLPGLSGFVGEFLVILSTVSISPWIAFSASMGVVLSAAYSLGLYGRLCYGKTCLSGEKIPELTGREFCLLSPLILLIVVVGLYPKSVLNFITPAAELWIHQNLETQKGKVSLTVLPKPKITKREKHS